MNEAKQELLAHVAGLFESGLCSDIKVRCGDSVFDAHRAVLSIRSPVLERAICGGFKETTSNEIDLSDKDDRHGNDPVAIKMLLQFIYSGDYQAPTDPYGRNDRYSISESQQSATTNSNGTLRNVEEEEEADRAQDPTTSQGAQLDNQDRTDESAEDDSMACGILALHAKIYKLADKYDIPLLMRRAVEQFSDDAEMLIMDEEAFCDAMRIAFDEPPLHDETLREAVVTVLHDRIMPERQTSVLDEQIEDMPALALRLYKHGLEVSKGPHCDKCGTVLIRQCQRGNIDGWGARGCMNYFATCRCLPSDTACDACREEKHLQAGLGNKRRKKLAHRRAA